MVGLDLQNPRRDRVWDAQDGRGARPELASTGKAGCEISKSPTRGFLLKMGGGLFRQADTGGACAQAPCSVRDVMDHDGKAIRCSPAARALAGRTSTASAANRASRFLQQVGTKANCQGATPGGARNRQPRRINQRRANATFPRFGGQAFCADKTRPGACLRPESRCHQC